MWATPTVFPTPWGARLQTPFGLMYLAMRNGGFEREEILLMQRVLPGIDRFIDIGANVGYHASFALHNRVPVTAFEPQEQNLRSLEWAREANEWGERIEIVPLALSDRPGIRPLFGDSGMSASLIPDWDGNPSRNSALVQSSTLDLRLDGRYSDQRLFIKMDVEGAEFSVLNGALATLARSPRPVWLIEIFLQKFHPGGKNQDFLRLFDLFFDSGYEAFGVAESLLSISRKDIRDWFRKGRMTREFCNFLFIDQDQRSSFFPTQS